jgi:hypothetical protein
MLTYVKNKYNYVAVNIKIHSLVLMRGCKASKIIFYKKRTRVSTTIIRIL